MSIPTSSFSQPISSFPFPKSYYLEPYSSILILLYPFPHSILSAPYLSYSSPFLHIPFLLSHSPIPNIIFPSPLPHHHFHILITVPFHSPNHHSSFDSRCLLSHLVINSNSTPFHFLDKSSPKHRYFFQFPASNFYLTHRYRLLYA